MVPFQDPAAAVAELRRAREELGFVAAFVRPNPCLGRTLVDPANEPFWAAAEELGVAVAVHEGLQMAVPPLGSDRHPTNVLVLHAISHTLEQMLACAQLIGLGVLERHPALRVVFLEAGGGWAPYWLARLDHQVPSYHRYAPGLSLLPSEYFARQCWVSFEIDEDTLPALVPFVGDDRIVWGSDYPHADSTFPGAVKELRRTIAPLPEDARRPHPRRQRRRPVRVGVGLSAHTGFTASAGRAAHTGTHRLTEPSHEVRRGLMSRRPNVAISHPDPRKEAPQMTRQSLIRIGAGVAVAGLVALAATPAFATTSTTLHHVSPGGPGAGSAPTGSGARAAAAIQATGQRVTSGQRLTGLRGAIARARRRHGLVTSHARWSATPRPTSPGSRPWRGPSRPTRRSQQAQDRRPDDLHRFRVFALVLPVDRWCVAD